MHSPDRFKIWVKSRILKKRRKQQTLYLPIEQKSNGKFGYREKVTHKKQFRNELNIIKFLDNIKNYTNKQTKKYSCDGFLSLPENRSCI